MKTLKIPIPVTLIAISAVGLALAFSGSKGPLFERGLLNAVVSKDGAEGHENHDGGEKHEHPGETHKAGDGHDHDDEEHGDSKDHDHDGDDDHDDHRDHKDHEGHDHGDDAGGALSRDDHEGHAHDVGERDGQKAHDHDGTGAANAKSGAKHEDHDDHDGHDAHDGHDDHGGGVSLTESQMDAFDVRMAAVSGGPIAITIERPAEVVYDENRLAHVVPRVGGIVAAVNASEGDAVIEGQVLAVLESRELADAKAIYLASLERLELAEDNYARAEALIDKRIVSEKTFLTAKTDFAEARINLRSARQKLFALGVNKNRLKEITEEADADLTQYIMRAPLGGTVVRRHLARGESVDTDREAFIIADVSTVWVDISVYPHDRERVKAGQAVAILTESGVEAEGTIAFVMPFVSEETRTANARVVLSNEDMRLRPGMFVTAAIAVEEAPAKVRIPATALQTHEGQDIVFVRGEEGRFTPRPVSIGRRNGHHAEVVAGLEPGEAVVTEGAFIVKSQLAKSGFDDGHNH